MLSAVTFFLGGRPTTVGFGADLPPATTVLNYLRRDPARAGVKEGCAQGDCGACTVVLAEPHNGRLRYRAVDSCLLFLPVLHGKQLITVEDLRDPGGELHPVQRALVDLHGSQCGFCTPGIVMSIFALAKNRTRPTEEEVRLALVGNLCRCTGYAPVIAAAARACAGGWTDRFDADRDRVRALLEAIPAESLELATPRQIYLRPRTLREALELRRQRPGAVVINGGTDVALRVAKGHELIPEILDLSGVDELRHAEDHNGELRIGAGTSMEELLAFARDRLPALHAALLLFGSGQIRTMATLGGNLGTASPVGDTLPVLMAHRARIVLDGPRGERRVDAADFAAGYRKTACGPDELITAVTVPRPARGTPIRWYKISKRRDLDISAVSGGFRLELDDAGRVTAAVLAYGGMAELVRRARSTEAFLQGRPWNRTTVEEAMRVLDGEFSPISDARGSAEFRRIAARNLLLKFWADPAAREAGTPPGE